MRILLINPPREHMTRWSVNDWKLDLGEISSFPPIGLMYIASYLREHTHHEVRIIDELYTKYLSARELSDLYREAHIRYYRRPAYILRRLSKLRSFTEFKVKAKAALAVLR